MTKAPATSLEVASSSDRGEAVSESEPGLPKQDIAGVILAGGLGRRMGGQDKGLLQVNGRPLIAHVIDAVLPQVGALFINANRNLDAYRAFGFPVIQDIEGEFAGPLMGVASAMRATDAPYVLSVPCDAPLMPKGLCARLFQAMETAAADISVVHDGDRMQTVFALMRRELLADLLSYLARGGRRIDTWYRGHRLTLADFSDCRHAFLNVNTPQVLNQLQSQSVEG